jgi:FMN phosphatase YigB (HAD superfamily)
MPLTLLLDLDDTLLETNVGDFLPAYFHALSRHLSRWVEPDFMLPALMSGTQRMLENTDASVTLQEVFDRDFYPEIGIQKEQLEDAVQDFYDHVFPRLAGVTRQRPGAQELVEWALSRGDRVAIATDPLLPLKAVHERIRWAGLDPSRFELVSSYETFHFTKSHPSYYAEVLGRLGWPDGPVLMVGNDEERDLACAERLGLSTYQVDATAAPVSVGSQGAVPASHLRGRGTLVELRNWLEITDSETLEPSYLHKDSALSILRSSPAVLQGLASGLSAERWRYEPTPDDWALIEIVCHMRDTEREVHRDQLRTLLEEPHPFVPRPDAAVWAKQRKYLNENGARAVEEFADARRASLETLRGLDETVWERAARHAIFGPTNFTEVVGFMADHDRLHIQQAWQTLRASA